ncbi:MAG: hypothetical protein JWN98_415, partial [Abditibacteriota bacterium]|nr:hypothetical protein [Abditibacteriota bacterium]
ETDFKNIGRAFPHVLSDPTGKPTAGFYEAFTATPAANAYQFAAAQAAIENEALGTDQYTDILGLSLTATDIAGHAWGPDSHEVQDLIVRLDGQLGDFIEAVNRRFRGNEVLWALTADHGACPLPEHMASLGFEAGRIKKKAIEDVINGALNTRFGALAAGQKWVLALEDPAIYLNRVLIAEKKLSFAEVQRVAGEASLAVPGMMAYYTREQLLSGTLPDNPWAQAFERSYHAERGGDVLLQTKPFYFWGSYGERDAGSTHGSPYDYDSHVPLIFAGAGVRPGRYAMNVEIVDLAPTLATLMGINAPSGNEGRALHELFAPNVSASTGFAR